MSDHIERVNAFLHAYWNDDVERISELVDAEFVWDNVCFHSFRREGDELLIERPSIRRGVAGLGSKSKMQFHDAKTGELVPQDPDAGGHEVLSEVVAPNGVVYQERYDIVGIRGAKIRMRCVGVFEFASDRICMWRDFFEFGHWTAQLALLGLQYAGYATDKPSSIPSGAHSPSA